MQVKAAHRVASAEDTVEVGLTKLLKNLRSFCNIVNCVNVNEPGERR